MANENTCPICHKDAEESIGEHWDALGNTEYRFYECPNKHRFTIIQEYEPRGKPITVKDWDMMPNYANDFGRFYIGTIKDDEFLVYSEDGVPFGNCVQWGFYTVDAQKNGRVFTRMNIKQAKEQIEIIEKQHPKLRCFIIPKEEAEKWGICTE